ncbi:hypothetical protein SAMN03159406_00565 [Rhizobium sp. NFR03]|nr:hypothetical protein SAMN03159406_00565 [Rhizobium sp. NFR03]
MFCASLQRLTNSKGLLKHRLRQKQNHLQSSISFDDLTHLVEREIRSQGL